MTTPLRWAVGVTTTPRRINDLLPRTLDSLKGTGFPKPYLFVDGSPNGDDWLSRFNLAGITLHHPALKALGNWDTALRTLFVREPAADRYAVFQDDLVAVKDLRQYLDGCPYRGRTYWNLYLFPANQALAPAGADGAPRAGWYESDQLGKGAVALVFSRDAAIDLASSRHMAERPMSAVRAHKSVDGSVVSALKSLGYREMVHYPSLTQHMGELSSIGNKPQPQAPSFPGEGHSALRPPDG